MHRQFIFTILVALYTPIIFAAVLDISGTYTGTQSYSKICSTGQTISGQETVSNFMVYQLTGDSSYSSEWNQTSIERGETKIRTSQGSGTISENGDISGSFTTNIEKPGISFLNNTSGTINGTFNSANKSLTLFSEGSSIEYKNGTQFRTCTSTSTKVLLRTPTAEVQSTTGQTFSITPTTLESPTYFIIS